MLNLYKEELKMNKEEMIKILKERYEECKKASNTFSTVTLKSSYQGEMLGLRFAIDLLMKEDTRN